MAYTSLICMLLAVSLFDRAFSNNGNGKCTNMAMEAGTADVSDGLHFGWINVPRTETIVKPQLVSKSFKFSASIATYSEDGLIFYALSPTDDTVFIALYFEEGRIVFKSSQLQSVSMIVTDDVYNDGKFHTVLTDFTKDGGELFVDGALQGTLNSTSSAIKDVDELYVAGLPGFMATNASLYNITSTFCGCIANINATEPARFFVQERMPCSISSSVHSTEETSFNFTEAVTVMTTENDIESIQMSTKITPDSTTEKEQTTAELLQSTIVFDKQHFTTEQKTMSTTRPSKKNPRKYINSKFQKQTQPPKILLDILTTVPMYDRTVETLSQKVYGDDPMSNIPIYVCVAIVVITIACVSHLVYRKTKRLVNQKQEYDKIPLQEMHQSNRKPKQQSDIKGKEKRSLSLESQDDQSDAGQGHHERGRDADGQTSKSKDNGSSSST